MKLISTTLALMLMVSGVVFTADKHDHGHEDKPSMEVWSRKSRIWTTARGQARCASVVRARSRKPVDVSKATAKSLCSQVATSKRLI